MDESVKGIVALAEEKFFLGIFAIGVVLLFFGIYTDPTNIERISATELLLFAYLGAAFIAVSILIWVKGNDYKANALNLEIEVKKINLDNEIKSKQLELQAQIARKPDFD
jgi:hypothetical protein